MGADAAIDLPAATAAYATGTDGTVGIEEEFMLLDESTLDLVPRFEELSASTAQDPVLAVSVAGELIRTEIEIRSGRGENLGEALEAQRVHRDGLFAHASRMGIRLGATGTHPWDDYRHQTFIDTEHYRRVVDGLRWVARRNATFSLHVHVGIRDPDRAIAVCDRLRPVLPMLLALSSNSPFVDGLDTGLHSARTQTFTKSFPRCGVPDAFGSWRAFCSYVELLQATDSIQEYTQVWWSVRPHISFGTVEIRICDAQSTAEESEALTGLIVACALQAARDHDEGRPVEHLPARLIEENLWRAIRNGRSGRLVDWDAREEYPSAGALDRLLAWTAPVRAEQGIDPVFPERNGAERQRDRVADGASPAEAFAAAVAETQATYPASPDDDDAQERST
ncbi:YbdK family carboxylate-amine ligase [Patulibacter sp.]|uniref:carboxylate-amine ligase n=1 Tax=Patulibacter sp. TaxID=1912859 RepID=UPI00271F2A42|nr:YbdK family carboxylate-amine ligase [Patulibacter sp.]MDO9410044.1 YbdK family carboxylate-amine ligase [Patulibacter sp.]